MWATCCVFVCVTSCLFVIIIIIKSIMWLTNVQQDYYSNDFNANIDIGLDLEENIRKQIMKIESFFLYSVETLHN